MHRITYRRDASRYVQTRCFASLSPHTNPPMINIALASFGMSGLVFHGPLISAHPQFTLYKILERRRQDSAARFPQATIVRHYEDILDDEAVDVVVVNTPNPYHYEMSRAALEAGKHVVVEKPFTNTVNEGQQLIDLAQQQGKLLTVFQNRRWDSDFLTVQKVLEQHLLGEVVEYEAHYDRFRNYIQPDTWKEEEGPGSGILYNLGAHMIDQALVLFELPHTLYAKLSTQRNGGKVPDAYHLLLYYDHFQVVLRSSYLVRDPGPRYKILGQQGTFTKHGIDPQEDYLKLGISPDNEQIGVEPEEQWGTLHTELHGTVFQGKIASETGNYSAFYDNLYDTLQGKTPLAVPPEQALDVIRLIELAYESSHSGKEVKV